MKQIDLFGRPPAVQTICTPADARATVAQNQVRPVAVQTVATNTTDAPGATVARGLGRLACDLCRAGVADLFAKYRADGSLWLLCGVCSKGHP